MPRDPTARPSTVDLDLTPPRVVHIVGVGGAGMSAIATVLARMGHRVSGSDLRESRALERARAARRRHVTSATPPRTCPPTLDAVVDLHRDRRRATPRSSRRASAASRCCAAPTRCAPSSPRARTIAVAGSHGKTTTSSMLALILRAAGLAPELPHRRRRQRGRHQRGVRRRRVARGRGRRERRHVPRARARRRDRHQRRARPPRPLRRLRRAGRRVRDASSRRVPGVRVLCADDDGRGRASRRGTPGAIVTYGFADGADYRIDDYEGGRGGTPVHARRAAASRSGVVELPVPGPPQRGERGRRGRDRARARRALRRGHARARRASAAWPAASSSGASATASPSSTTTRTSRARSTP